MLGRIALIVAVVFMGLAYQAIKPPHPVVCGSPNGPPVTSPRIKLRDGRYLAYRETGVPREKAKYKIIFAHGFRSSKEFTIPASPELIEELGVCFVSFDRAGYGQSDPYPNRSVKSEALDIDELADQLELGPKFYVLGISMGGYPVWSSLKYIPHRLAGAGLIAPAINYWWPSFPANLTRDVFRRLLVGDQLTYGIAYYAPSLINWWLTQKWLPSFSQTNDNPDVFSAQDIQLLANNFVAGGLHDEGERQHQSKFESLHRDLVACLSTWEFDPMELENPFNNNEGSVHLWQGHEDRIIPFELQRYVAKRLPWIKYHEYPDGGHLFVLANGFGDSLLRQLLLGEEVPNNSL